MKFRSQEHQEVFRTLVGGDAKTPIDKLTEVYLSGRGEYVNRATGWRRSQIAKNNWRKHRFSYEAGIKRYHRSGSVMKDAKQLLLGLRSRVRINPNAESLEVDYQMFKGEDLLELLAQLRLNLVSEAQFFDLEENYVEYSLMLEKAYGAIASLEVAILNRATVSFSEMEMVLALLNYGFLMEKEASISQDEGFLDHFLQAKDVK